MDGQFEPVSLEKSESYYQFWDTTPRRSLDYTLPNLWGWQQYYGMEWRFDENFCWIRQTRPFIAHWAPLGNWNGVNWEQVMASVIDEEQRHFIRVPAELVEIWQNNLPGRVDAAEDRGQWEYLYLQEDLANLSGNKFHKKRNHLNAFIKAYGDPDYRVVKDGMVSDVLSVQDDWCHWHECDDSPSLRAENDAINRVLAHWHKFRDLRCGSIYVDGRMIAFSVGEKLDDQTLGVHFEKGLNGYKGVYQAMNYEFARHAGEGFKWINRAQDLGEEGLRQAKLTYLPADFLRKFIVTVRKSA